MENPYYKKKNVERKFLKSMRKNHFLKIKNNLLELEKDFIELKDTEMENREVGIKREIF